MKDSNITISALSACSKSEAALSRNRVPIKFFQEIRTLFPEIYTDKIVFCYSLSGIFLHKCSVKIIVGKYFCSLVISREMWFLPFATT